MLPNTPNRAPATGSADPQDTDLPSEEEPISAGTIFLTVIFLMLIFGFWIMMYIMLLER